MNDETVLAVGTVIVFPGKTKLTITGIEVHKFLGDWETQVIVDWENLETGEKKTGRVLGLANLASTLNSREWELGNH